MEEEMKVEEVVEVKESFIKKHASKIKKGLIGVGTLAAVGIAAAVINNKRKGDIDSDYDEEGTDDYSADSSSIE